MVLSIVERIKGFLFSPSKTFDASKEDSLGDAFTYFMVILVIYAALLALITTGLFTFFGGMLNLPEFRWFAALGPLVGALFFVYALVVGILSVFIFGLWLHLWVFLLGGRNGLVQTIKAVLYGETPSLVLGWIPIINLIAGIWALIVGIIGLRQLQELSTGKATIAVIIALIIPAIVVGALIAALIIGQMMPPSPSLGPRFGGW